MKWTARHTLIGGLALILLTNAIALLGVYRNRADKPESMLTLTERELHQPYRWGVKRENSGIALNLDWRVISADKSWNYPHARGNPEWLDQAKMLSLGFKALTPMGERASHRRDKRLLSREVLLVLELDGPAYQKALEQARQRAAEQEAKLAALPNDRNIKDEAKHAREALNEEERKNSRLFAVDAGLDATALRARYLDRSRYAIVRAQVKPWFGAKNELTGFIDKLSVGQINVPHDYRPIFDEHPRHTTRDSTEWPFQAEVAFGQRLEPWVVRVKEK